MSNFTGMDISGVRQMATQMDTAAGEIENLMSRLSSVLEGTQWVGTDATNFRSEWTGAHCGSLRQISERLRQVSQVARQNADQQEAASA